MAGFTPEMRAKAAATIAARQAAKAAEKEQAMQTEPVVMPAATGEFGGMTKTSCPDACGPKGCVISGRAVCAHPFKGGLQAAQMNDNKVVSRYSRAKEYLKNA